MVKKTLTRLIQATALGGVLIGFSQLTLHAAQMRALHGHVPAVIANLAPIGRLPGSQRLDLAVGLPLRNREELANLLDRLYDPGSAQYHQYLTPEQFTELFGPTAGDYAALNDFAQANGMKVIRTYPNRVVLDINASVADIERAFHITMRVYQHPTEPRTFYAPDTEPTVDSTVPILDISGLDDSVLPRPLLHGATGKNPVEPDYGSGSGGTYLGKDFRAAYAPGVGATGLGQAVGLLEFDGYYASDITSYESLASLPNVTLSNVLLDNFNGNPGSGNIEVALDIEMAIAMAPGLNQVIVYEAGPKGIPNDILSRMLSDNLAKQLSSSWTWGGGPNSTTDSLFQQMAVQGQSFFQAAGDSDAYTSLIPEPADNPYITIVGGTILRTTGPGGGPGFGSDLELVQYIQWHQRHRWWHQHYLRHSRLAAGYQHDRQPRLDHHAQHSRRGADGRQYLGHLQQWQFRRGRGDQLCSPAVGGVYGTHQPASAGKWQTARRLSQSGHLFDWKRQQL